jgi:hypothetical protein
LKPSVQPEHEPIVRPDEKRELILAHAAMRRTHDPVQLMSLWAGVVATFVVVVAAWWWASKPAYLRAFSEPPLKGFEAFTEQADKLGVDIKATSAERTSQITADLNVVSNRLDALNANIDRIAGLVSSTQPTHNVFQSQTSTQP